MTLTRLILLPLAALASGATQAAPPPLAPHASNSAAAARVRAHVEFLADDLLEGRGTGTRGHEIAAAYVAAQFRAMGLQPGGENGGWYQWVPLRRATLVPAKTNITMTIAGRTAPVSEFDLGLRPSITDRVRAIDAGMVFVGYGLVRRVAEPPSTAGVNDSQPVSPTRYRGRSQQPLVAGILSPALHRLRRGCRVLSCRYVAAVGLT